MHNDEFYNKLTSQQINALIDRGCTAEDWTQVKAAGAIDVSRLRNVHFSGKVRIGRLEKKVLLFGGIEKKAGLYNATIHNCRIGDNVFISNVENYIANYDIGDDVVIEHIWLMAVDGTSSFGNGTEVAVIQELGGRQIPICDRLSSHIAYMLAMYRHNRNLTDALRKMLADYVASVTSQTGKVGQGAKIINCGTLKNVIIAPAAVIEGASLLENGSVNSSFADPSFVGTNVIARDFIICSGAKVSENSIISKCFVGQGTELSKQYSAENSVFFANCKGYHGEACSVFAGPFTVTHHKSTLLIAGLYSFLNAGSGSNQSNHMYKLGPVHQGIVERGSKTTSDSYILWPSRIGAFSLVMGRHYSNADTSNLPFSYVIEHQDESVLVPGVNLRSVGTIRDWRKWPGRDNRKDPDRLDLIIYNLLTPYTVQKMLNGLAILNRLNDTSGQASQHFYYNGVKIKRSSLENGIKYYQMGIDRFIGNTLVKRLMEKQYDSADELLEALRPTTQIGKGDWIDMAGLIAPQQALRQLTADVESRRIDSLENINLELSGIYKSFDEFEWTWVVDFLEKKFEKTIDCFTPADLTAVICQWLTSVEKLDTMRIADAQKEFSPTSKTGFGIDGSTIEQDGDFAAVRGSAEQNDFILDMQKRLLEKQKTAAQLTEKLQTLTCCSQVRT